MLRTSMIVGICFAGTGAALTGCSDYREHRGASALSQEHATEAEQTIALFKEKDPTLEKFFSGAVGYVVFPDITKGAAGIGAAHGNGGVVYENGRVIGAAEMTQVTIGAQLGGQGYSEIVFFKDQAALDDFKRNNLEFAANASAVGATSGAGVTSDYSGGVAVFTLPKGGLMFEASIGGQKFRFTPS